MTKEEMITALNAVNVKLNMTGWESNFLENVTRQPKLSGKQITVLYDLVLKYTKEGIK